MKYDPTQHHRRNIRLKGPNYSQTGAHFVTILIQDRACLYGHITDDETRLNAYGKIVGAEWFQTAQVRPSVVL